MICFSLNNDWFVKQRLSRTGSYLLLGKGMVGAFCCDIFEACNHVPINPPLVYMNNLDHDALTKIEQQSSGLNYMIEYGKSQPIDFSWVEQLKRLL